MKILNLAFILTAFLIFLSSCEELDETEDLENAYIESVTIINIPPYYWDNGSSPDLLLKLAKQNSPEWTYLTNQSDNVESVPEILLFDEEINITNEDWELELVDIDDFNEDDQIYRIIFNPFDNAEKGKIPIYHNDLLVLEFNYNIK